MKKSQKRLWFRAKDYGWGWVPVTWQGWLITLIFGFLYAGSVILFMGWLGTTTETGGADLRNNLFSILEFIAWIAFLTFGLIRICYRYGERPVWRWGRKAEDT
ncbi:MAG: hypothetical protein JWN64_107 [Parcubacteria group bacterium]|nr:hypothetical protein [Parcubacteria group bacterium]